MNSIATGQVQLAGSSCFFTPTKLTIADSYTLHLEIQVLLASEGLLLPSLLLQVS